MTYYKNSVEFSILTGKTLTAIRTDQDGSEEDITEIYFETDEGEEFTLYHSQDCCEYVRVESIVGELTDLIGWPILMAEESTNEGTAERGYDSQTWTFYKLATNKGYVDIRWIGESNGYYSESVYFRKTK